MLGPDGACSLIRLPLGIHRQTCGWYPFVQVDEDGEVVPVGETMEACCAWACQHVQRVAVPEAVQVGGGAPGDGVIHDASITAGHRWSLCSPSNKGRPCGGRISSGGA